MSAERAYKTAWRERKVDTMVQGIIERAKGILLSPKAEWEKIDSETVDQQSIVTGYVLPLVAAAAIAGLIGMSIFGIKVLGVTYRPSFFGALPGTVIQIAFGVAFVFVFAFIINALAPTFGATKDWGQAFKVAAYAPTAAWVASLLAIIPLLSILGAIGGLYSLYLLFVGLPKLMKPPAEKATTYTIASIVAAIIASIVFGTITSMFMPKVDTGALSGSIGTINGNDINVSELEQRAEALERAAESGDIGAIMGAVTDSLGGDNDKALVDSESLRALAPETIAGMTRKGLDIERVNAPIKMVMMTARYENERDEDNKRITLQVANSPALSVMFGFANFGIAEYDRSSDDGYEKLTRKGETMVMEEWKNTGAGSYAQVIDQTFMVQAEGSSVTMEELKAAANAISVRDLKNLPKTE